MTDLYIYGSSDDLVEVEGAINEEFGYRNTADDKGDLLAFSDGTVVRIRYDDNGVWRITPVARGTAELTIEQAPEDDEKQYTDRATLAGDVRWVVHGDGWAK